MKCPDAHHVHAHLECKACSEVGEYIFVKAEEAFDCVHCGFEIQVAEEQLAGIRESLDFRNKRVIAFGTPLAPSIFDIKVTQIPWTQEKKDAIDLYWRDAEAYYSAYVEPRIPPGLDKAMLKGIWDQTRPRAADMEELRRLRKELEPFKEFDLPEEYDERHGTGA